MMLDMPMRLVVAYGLIALMALAIMAVVVWRMRNTHARRYQRERTRAANRRRG